MDVRETHRVRVWDAPTRLFHGLLALGVGVAWLTAGDARWLHLHVFAGAVTAALALFRVVWGFAGGRHARFRAFVRGAAAVRAHARELARGEARRHLGHDPLAGWAMLAALALVLLLAATGFVVLGGEEGQGPLAGALTVGQGVALHAPHEALAWALAAWLGLHLAGVAWASLRHREVLPLAMVTGRKRAAVGTPSERRHGAVAALMLLALAAGGVAAFRGALATPAGERWRPYAGRPLPDDATWREACGECHLAYPPSLLPARSWAAMLDGQADHFGEDLALDEAASARVREFLVRNAAEREANEAAWYVARTTPPAEAPLRVTALPWWRERHARIDETVFQREDVGGAGRCGACHADADAGTFTDGAMRIP